MRLYSTCHGRPWHLPWSNQLPLWLQWRLLSKRLLLLLQAHLLLLLQICLLLLLPQPELLGLLLLQPLQLLLVLQLLLLLRLREGRPGNHALLPEQLLLPLLRRLPHLLLLLA